VRGLICHLGISVADVSSEAGVNRSFLYDILRGNRRLRAA
jgi:hypothetical protein